jgi:hypothetical protein
LSLSCRPATKKQIPPSAKYQGRFRQNRRPATKKRTPPYVKKPGRFRQNRRPAAKNKTQLTPKTETAARKTVVLRLKNKPAKQNLFHRCNSF